MMIQQKATFQNKKAKLKLGIVLLLIGGHFQACTTDSSSEDPNPTSVSITSPKAFSKLLVGDKIWIEWTGGNGPYQIFYSDPVVNKARNKDEWKPVSILEQRSLKAKIQVPEEIVSDTIALKLINSTAKDSATITLLWRQILINAEPKVNSTFAKGDKLNVSWRLSKGFSSVVIYLVTGDDQILLTKDASINYPDTTFSWSFLDAGLLPQATNRVRFRVASYTDEIIGDTGENEFTINK